MSRYYVKKYSIMHIIPKWSKMKKDNNYQYLCLQRMHAWPRNRIFGMYHYLVVDNQDCLNYGLWSKFALPW